MNVLAKHEVDYIYDHPSQESGLAKDNNILKIFNGHSGPAHPVIRLKGSVEQMMTATGDMVMVRREEVHVETPAGFENCLFDASGHYRHEAAIRKIEPDYDIAI